ncbi:unnamed protein product [Effrenium voratum]|nr:unnamed protein product [Effrenium voratum]
MKPHTAFWQHEPIVHAEKSIVPFLFCALGRDTEPPGARIWIDGESIGRKIENPETYEKVTAFDPRAGFVWPNRDGQLASIAPTTYVIIASAAAAHSAADLRAAVSDENIRQKLGQLGFPPVPQTDEAAVKFTPLPAAIAGAACRVALARQKYRRMMRASQPGSNAPAPQKRQYCANCGCQSCKEKTEERAKKSARKD